MHSSSHQVSQGSRCPLGGRRGGRPQGPARSAVSISGVLTPCRELTSARKAASHPRASNDLSARRARLATADSNRDSNSISSDGTRFRRLLLVIAGASAVLLAGCSSGGSSSANGSSSQAAGRSYNLPSSVKTLEVSNQGGTTQVTAMQSSSQISVVERPTGDATSDHNVAGSAGTVSSHCPGGISIRDCHMDYQITMPPSVALNVRGDVGLVRLQGGLAKAQIQTDAGEVSGTGLGRGSYTVTTDAGRVKLTFTSAPTLVKVTTSVGAIDVTVPSNASYRVNASSEVGGKDVTVPNHATATNVIDLHAEVGTVSLHKG
jgi:hypothetical protein